MEMKKLEIYMKKPVYLGQVILDISKTLMYKFWYEYVKPKYADKAKYVIWTLIALLYM